MRPCALLVAVGLGMSTVLHSASSIHAAGEIEIPLDRRAVEEALAIAHSSIESTHRRFHANYRFTAGKAPLDFVEVVSPFRRLVIAAETQLRSGRRMFGQREAIAALGPEPERIDFYAELTFHPHNTFVRVPDYTLELVPVSSRSAALLPDTIDRVPRFGPRLEQPAYSPPNPYPVGPVAPSAGSQPLLGATLIAHLGPGTVDPTGVYDVVVKDEKVELARARVDLGRIR